MSWGLSLCQKYGSCEFRVPFEFLCDNNNNNNNNNNNDDNNNVCLMPKVHGIHPADERKDTSRDCDKGDK